MTTPVYVELVSGQIVTRNAEEWRHECLARHVLELPSKAARVEWLEKFTKVHGEAATQALRDTMTALWNKERAA